MSKRFISVQEASISSPSAKRQCLNDNDKSQSANQSMVELQEELHWSTKSTAELNNGVQPPPSPASSESSILTSSSSSSSTGSPDLPPLKSRLALFLPLLAASNTELEHAGRSIGGFEITDVDEEEAQMMKLSPQAISGTKKKKPLVMDVEDGNASFIEPAHEEDEDEGPYIEMNLNLGVLEDRAAQSSSDDDDSSRSEDEDSDLKGADEVCEQSNAAMDELLCIGKPTRKKKRKQVGIVELS